MPASSARRRPARTAARAPRIRAPAPARTTASASIAPAVAGRGCTRGAPTGAAAAARRVADLDRRDARSRCARTVPSAAAAARDELLHPADERRQPARGRADAVLRRAAAPLGEQRAEQAAVLLSPSRASSGSRTRSDSSAGVAGEDARDHRADEHPRGLASDVALGKGQDALVAARRARRERLGEDAQLAAGRQEPASSAKPSGDSGTSCSRPRRKMKRRRASSRLGSSRGDSPIASTKRQRGRRVVEEAVGPGLAEIAVHALGSDVAADAVPCLRARRRPRPAPARARRARSPGRRCRRRRSRLAVRDRRPADGVMRRSRGTASPCRAGAGSASAARRRLGPREMVLDESGQRAR